MFFLDSGAYSQTEGIDGYDWVRPSQIEWYRTWSRALADKQGGIVDAFAFFHIPLPEYAQAGFRDSVGERWESVQGPQINSGLFAAFLAGAHRAVRFAALGL